MTTTRIHLLGAAALTLVLATGCGGDGSADPGGARPHASSEELDTAGPGLSRVVLLGDSVAKGEGVALSAAFGAADVEFSSMASDGGGNVVGPFSDKQWKRLSHLISTAKPSTVIYQITTYDWGTEDEQRTGYDRLVDEVAAVGGKVVFVSMPPIRPDDFYAPHLTELERAPEVAGAVARDSAGGAVFLDAGEVWGDSFQQERDGKADRSSDGIHTCPQGAARFSVWLLGELADLYPSFDPADPADWANTGWSADAQFVGC
jgi:hypothetical protein